MLRLSALALGASLLIGATVGASATETMKVHGAATVGRLIIVPNQDAIEGEVGFSLDVVQNGSANGLKDLASGTADLAMIAAPIEVEAALSNEKEPGSLDVTGFQSHPVGAVTISFVVHPSNPVKSLTEAQLKDLFTGKVANWKEVGGPDLPVVVIAETVGQGTRANVEATFLGGAEITGSARIMQALLQVVQVVAQVPGAIGYGNSASITEAVSVVPGVTVPQPLAIVTRGAPSAEAQRLIDAAVKYAPAG